MDNQDLQLLVESLSIEYFNNPFNGEAYFNQRLRTTGGRYIPSKKIIEINPKYLIELGEDELKGIIKHELCHHHLHIQGKPYHHRSREFRELLKQTGSPRFCKMLPSTENRRRLKYMCIKCGLAYNRQRKINLSKYRCGKCKGKLKLIE